jgi:hypothetical protein
MSGFPITSLEALDEVNHGFYKNLVLAAASKPFPPVQADTKKIVPANTVNKASALPSPKTAAVLVSPVLQKSAQFTNADDVHSSSALLASPINMLPCPEQPVVRDQHDSGLPVFLQKLAPDNPEQENSFPAGFNSS